MRRRIGILLLSGSIACAAGWFLWPWIVVTSLNFVGGKGEEPSRRACDRIVAVGERAIPAIISSIEAHSPWVRRHCYLPIALKEIGGSAQAQLLAAVGNQPDPLKRTYLISTLQTAFDDYSQFETVLGDYQAGRISDWGLFHMAAQFRVEFSDAPLLLAENRKLSPGFMTYWRQRVR